MYKFNSNCGFVCHDAGAANILISALLHSGEEVSMVSMEGPAKKIWKAAFPNISCDVNLQYIVKNCEHLFTGSGWSSDLEFNAISMANETKLMCSTVMDHWVNYQERLCRNGRTVYPNNILVTDEEAFALAKDIFPDKKIILFENLYLRGELNKIASAPLPANTQILFVNEPIRNKWGRDTPGEFQVLDYFLSTLDEYKISNDIPIVLRPHPSEYPKKYDRFINSSNREISLSQNIDIATDISQSTMVVGCNSYGLVIALISGKKVYSALPPWAPPSCLPQRGILPLSSIRNTI